MAQDFPLPREPEPAAQSHPSAADSLPASDPTRAPAPPRVIIPVPTQTHPFVYLRPMKRPPLAAGYGPVFNVSTGYSVTSLATPSSGRVALNGINAGLSADAGKRFGAALNLGYAQASNILNSGHPMSMLSYLVGPVILLSDGNLLSTYAHFVVGGASVVGPLPSTNGGLRIGHVHYPAWAVGGCAEYPLSRAFGLRVTVDYMHTQFFNSSQAVRGQNSLRVVNSLVYYLGARPLERRQE
jgi:hypothetical protein